jgi:hypothetical protein
MVPTTAVLYLRGRYPRSGFIAYGMMGNKGLYEQMAIRFSFLCDPIHVATIAYIPSLPPHARINGHIAVTVECAIGTPDSIVHPSYSIELHWNRACIQ